MGGFDSFSTILGGAGKVANATSGLRKSYSSYRDVTSAYQQAKENYDANEKALAEKAVLDQKQLQLESDKAAADRKNALKRAVATQQAAFGGQGIDTTDGSGQAAILGLFKNSTDEKTYRNNLDNLKAESISQELISKRRKNLLDLQHNYQNARDGAIKNFDKLTDFSNNDSSQQESDNYFQ